MSATEFPPLNARDRFYAFAKSFKIMAISRNYFGFGKDIAEAKANLKKGGGKLTGCSIYVVPADYWVDEDGVGKGAGQAVLIDGPDLRG